MNTDQLDQLKSKYCEYIIDGMDMDCLIQMCYDLLMNESPVWYHRELRDSPGCAIILS